MRVHRRARSRLSAERARFQLAHLNLHTALCTSLCCVVAFERLTGRSRVSSLCVKGLLPTGLRVSVRELATKQAGAMRASLAAFGVVLCALSSFVQGMSWSTCGDGPFSASNVELKPDPPQVGSDVDFRIEGTYDPEGVCFCSYDATGCPTMHSQGAACIDSCSAQRTLQEDSRSTIPRFTQPSAVSKLWCSCELASRPALSS